MSSIYLKCCSSISDFLDCFIHANLSSNISIAKKNMLSIAFDLYKNNAIELNKNHLMNN